MRPTPWPYRGDCGNRTMDLTHVDENGRVRMVDVSGKPVTARRARAGGTIHVQQATLNAIAANTLAKGDVLAAARLAGIMAAKRCDELIPLCHSLPLGGVTVELEPQTQPPRIDITSEVTCTARTGAEMEALVAVSVAALTIYDMIKAIDRTAVIGDIRLLEKSGGKSGSFVREEKPCQDE